MKVGIIIHSHTGNTLSVGEKLRAAYTAAGCETKLERITLVDENPNRGFNVQLKDIPDASQFDILIFGAPVRGFSASPAIRAYLAQVSGIAGKKVRCYATEQFPKPWMGGNHAIKQMVAAVESKGAEVAGTGVINWSSKRREEQINELINRFGGT